MKSSNKRHVKSDNESAARCFHLPDLQHVFEEGFLVGYEARSGLRVGSGFLHPLQIVSVYIFQLALSPFVLFFSQLCVLEKK